MRSPDLEQFRERLLAERERLRRLLDGMAAEVASLAGHCPAEWAEHAQREGNLAVLTDLDEREWRALNNMEEALAKIEAGTYGICEACGTAVSLTERPPPRQGSVEAFRSEGDKITLRNPSEGGAKDEDSKSAEPGRRARSGDFVRARSFNGREPQ